MTTRFVVLGELFSRILENSVACNEEANIRRYQQTDRYKKEHHFSVRSG
jgi:hypothetical protein